MATGARELTLASDGLALFNKYRYEDFGNLLVVNHQSLRSLLLPQTNYRVSIILRPRNRNLAPLRLVSSVASIITRCWNAF